MGGTLLIVVGPSGGGKDTLMDAARAARPAIAMPRRVVTRPETAGGEAFRGVSPETFAEMREKGAFAFHWQAHGLCYGIPCGIDAELAAGRDVMFNGSRGIIAEARARYARLRILFVTAAPEVLAARLAARGREDARDIEARLARSGHAPPEGPDVTRIDNSGPLGEGIARFLAALPGSEGDR